MKCGVNSWKNVGRRVSEWGLDFGVMKWVKYACPFVLFTVLTRNTDSLGESTQEGCGRGRAN
eukprot:7596522-Alexandrium_andersonii.AAC.1